MEVVQIIKKLNNTELGKGGTHDTYVLIPQNLDISDIFSNINTPIDFFNKATGDMITVRHTVGREKRIVGLGPFYSCNDVCAGDEIVFERRTFNNTARYYIDLKKKDNIVIFQRMKKGFEVLNEDRLQLLNRDKCVTCDEDNKTLEVQFLLSDKKRQDSPELTDFYDIKIDGISIKDKFSTKELVEIEVNENKAKINKFCAWKKYKFEVEE